MKVTLKYKISFYRKTPQPCNEDIHCFIANAPLIAMFFSPNII